MSGHPHGHDHHDRDHHASPISRLSIVLALTLAYAVAEVLGGVFSNSLALLADAGHMLTDALALGLALAAAWFAKLPPDRARTYGYQRAEILAALANGVALVVICGFLFWEAWQRLFAPPEVKTGLMAWVAAGGLAVNMAALLLLREVHGLNARAAYLHVLGDLLGSVGTLVAAALVAAFGYRWADPVAGIVIGAIIVLGSVRLVLQSLNVLMEGVPREMDLQTIREALVALPGVAGMHDLHVWTLSSGRPILTAHLVLDGDASPARILRSACRTLEERFGIRHATIQIEPSDHNIFGHIGGERVGADLPPHEHEVKPT